MKRLLLAAFILTIGGLARAATIGPVAISSGTSFYNVDVSSIAATLRVRQNIVIADPSSNTGLAPVDPLNGLAVYLTTGTVGVIPTSSSVSGLVGAAKSGTWNALGVDVGTGTWPVSIVAGGTGGGTVTQGPAGTSGWKVDASTGLAVTRFSVWPVDVGTGTWPVSIVAGGTGGGTVTQGPAGTVGWFVDLSTGAQANLAVQASGGAKTNVGYQTGGSSVPVSVLNTVTITGSISNTAFTANQGTAGTSGWKVDFSTGVQVNGTVAATQSGAWATTVTQGPAGTSGWKVDATTGIYAVGGAAIDAAAVGNPLRAGGDARTTLPTAVSDGDAQSIMLDKFGRVSAFLDCPRDLIGKSSQTITTNTTELVLISSGASGVFNDIVSVIAVNTSATAARLDFSSGGGPSSQALDFAIYVPAGETRGFMTPHIWPQTTSAANWTIKASASVTDLRVYTSFCKNK